MPTIRVSEQTYRQLNDVAGSLRSKVRRPVSMDEVLRHLVTERRPRPSDYAGAWQLTEEEETRIFDGLRRFWARWRFRRG